MKQEKGIVLVSALVVMVAVLALGMGASFLTQMNLRIAENNRSNAMARYNAETGLDAALVSLARYFRDNEGAFPESEASFRMVFHGSSEYSLQSYERFAADQVRVVMAGSAAARTAQYVAEARLEGVITPSHIPGEMNPLFGIGFVSSRNITFNGNSSLDLNVWSGANVGFSGGQSRIGSGYWARAAGSKCEVGKASCPTQQTEPKLPKYSFDTERKNVIASITGITSNQMPAAACTHLVSKNQTVHDPIDRVICLAPNTTLTLTGESRNTAVIGDETTTVKLQGGSAPRSAEEPHGLTIVSGNVELDQNCNKNCAGLTGQNTIFAKLDIKFGKGVTSTDNVTRTLIATEGKVTLNGNGGRDIYASFWTGSSVEFNGKIGRFRGTIVAAGDGGIGVTGNGGVDDAGLPDAVDNPYIPSTTETIDYSDAGIRVLSRR